MTDLKLNDEFVVNLNGKSYVTYNGLIDLAHQIGLQSIHTELLQMPTADNGYMAVFKAIITDKEDRVFIGYGDASPESVANRLLVPHVLRMAETRAKARALRDLTNVGMTAWEELGSEDINSPNNKPTNRNTRQQASNQIVDKCSGCGTGITAKVKQYSINNYKKALCFSCQQKVNTK